MGFEWQTEEDTDHLWDDDLSPAEPNPNTPFTSRRLTFLLAAVILITLGYVTQRTLQQRADAREAQIISDVLAAYGLLEQAIEDGDLEVLRSVLSGNNAQWSQAQQTHLLNNQLLERPFTGWQHLIGDHAQISVNPRLSEVTATITQTYRIDNNLPIKQATIVQTAFFRLGEQGWLYTNPIDTYWGSEQQLLGEQITLVYPAIDDDYAQELAQFLDPLINRYCQQLSRCPNSLNITLNLNANPSTIPALFDHQQLDLGALQLIDLPTISLIGRPADAQSAQALYGIYGAAVLTALNRQYVIQERLGQKPFDLLLLDQQLAQLNLPQQYQPDTAALDPLWLAELLNYRPLWSFGTISTNGESLGRVHQLLTFLHTLNPDTNPLELQYALQLTTFDEWVETAVGHPLPAVGRAWLRHVHEQNALDIRPPSLDGYPDQLIGMLCVDQNETLTYVNLSRFGQADPRWSAGIGLDSVTDYQFTHQPLPTDNGFIIEQLPRTREGNWFTLLVQDDGSLFHTFDAETQRTPLAYTGRTTPDNQRLLMSAPNPEFGFTEFHLLDLNQCANDDCPLTLADGFPIWSPDGQHTLIVSFQGLHLGTADGLRQTRIGRGSNPFWVDSETFGYLRSLTYENQNGVLVARTGIVLGNINDPDNKETINDSTLATYTDPNGEAATFILEYATANPETGHLYIVGTTLDRDEYYLLEHRPNTGRTHLLMTIPELPGRLIFSPDGRWLTLTAFTNQPTNAVETNFGREEAYLYLLNLRTTEQQRYTFLRTTAHSRSTWLPDWSADNQWLLMNDEISIHLINPHLGYQQRLFHTYTTCQDAAWFNP